MKCWWCGESITKKDIENGATINVLTQHRLHKECGEPHDEYIGNIIRDLGKFEYPLRPRGTFTPRGCKYEPR